MRSVQIRAIAPLAKRSCLVLLAAGSLSLQVPAFAEDQETVNVDDVVAPLAPGVTSDTVTEDLIRLLTQRNALSHDDAQKLIERLRAAPPGATTPPAAAAPGAGENAGRVRVPYVPESEKQRIREEVKKEVLETAREERWGVPNTLPLWITRMRLSGDVRVREEFNYYDSANYPYQINFQAINSASSPINTNPFASQGVVLPYLNVTENREMLRLRARFGLETNIADDLIASFRLATGSSSNPVSTNQTLGSDFNKPTLLVDRAYLQYRPLTGLTAWAGRMANPWQSTELVFDEDLNFDGFAVQYKLELGDVTPRATFGVFSIENTPSDFPSSNFLKNKSRDKWLFAGQLGADWRVVPQFLVRGAAAYYDFQHVQGKPAPCATQYNLPCGADESRPGFLQKGNTLTALRIPDGTAAATDAEYQYFGLASPFRVLDLTVTLDWSLFSGRHLTLIGDYARNLAYDKKAIVAQGYANNFGKCGSSDTACQNNPPHRGGSQAYLAEMRFGQPNIKERGQWNMLGGYRRLATDAVMDAFTDSDFHLGGTNARGYYVGGGIGFTRNAWVSLRWFSALQASGEPMAIDVLQLDLNARF